ncbi:MULTISPECIES: hypothetical protein [Citrobacter]|uniref:hypothetical protein n=1 Tax=Citrobacter TaxID=544 RepID=UPI00227CC9F6|nr:hypothetical protein [Citrobacter sp. W8]
MTTITKERLQEVIDGDILFTDEQRELARIALASMDAEPVGYFYADKPGDWYQISDGDRVPDHRRIPLYSSPQSGQVVKLPNEFISNEGIVVQIEKVMAVLAVAGIQYERKGNACRAAMIQAGNSPVTPDGWQLVPKEPTAAMNKAGWAAMNEHDAINPTYRAMLAAAPKQEVKAALEHGMQRYAGAMQKLSEGDK